MTQEETIDRIKKLLRLGRRSDHVAEAESAMAKAMELADQAGIGIAGLESDTDTPKITHERSDLKRRSHSRARCHVILRRHFSVRVIGSSERGCLYVGPSANIAIARHVEEYLVRVCARCLSECQEKRKTRTFRVQFEDGFYAAISRTLRLRPIRNDWEAVSAAVEKYVGDHFKITHRSISNGRRNNVAFMHGVSSGLATPVDRPVTGSPAVMQIGRGL
jgi:hypothetical protein